MDLASDTSDVETGRWQGSGPSIAIIRLQKGATQTLNDVISQHGYIGGGDQWHLEVSTSCENTLRFAANYVAKPKSRFIVD